MLVVLVVVVVVAKVDVIYISAPWFTAPKARWKITWSLVPPKPTGTVKILEYIAAVFTEILSIKEWGILIVSPELKIISIYSSAPPNWFFNCKYLFLYLIYFFYSPYIYIYIYYKIYLYKNATVFQST